MDEKQLQETLERAKEHAETLAQHRGGSIVRVTLHGQSHGHDVGTAARALFRSAGLACAVLFEEAPGALRVKSVEVAR